MSEFNGAPRGVERLLLLFTSRVEASADGGSPGLEDEEDMDGDVVVVVPPTLDDDPEGDPEGDGDEEDPEGDPEGDPPPPTEAPADADKTRDDGGGGGEDIPYFTLRTCY